MEAVMNGLYQQTCFLRLIVLEAWIRPNYMAEIKGTDEYYTVSTLYALGTILAYHRILLLEGIYAQIEHIYPEFGSLLIKKFDEFGSRLDKMRIKNPQSDRNVKFFRYDRMALGDANTERESGTSRLVTYLKFSSMFETDTSIKSALEPAENLCETLSLRLNRIWKA